MTDQVDEKIPFFDEKGDSTMAVKRTKLKSSSSNFIWYMLAWFVFRTLPILYFKVTRNSEAVEQKKWEAKVSTEHC
jgi:hypothetical protein